MGIVLALLQVGRAVAAGYVLLVILIALLALLLALIAVLLVVLIVRVGRSGRGESPKDAVGAASEPPRAGEDPPTTGAEETPTSEITASPQGVPPPGEQPPTR